MVSHSTKREPHERYFSVAVWLLSRAPRLCSYSSSAPAVLSSGLRGIRTTGRRHREKVIGSDWIHACLPEQMLKMNANTECMRVLPKLGKRAVAWMRRDYHGTTARDPLVHLAVLATYTSTTTSPGVLGTNGGPLFRSLLHLCSFPFQQLAGVNMPYIRELDSYP